MLGVLTLVPYAYWKKTHAMHHATSGDLDRRGFGDVATLTVREYRALSWGRRLGYRIYRNPFGAAGGRAVLPVRAQAPTAARHSARLEARVGERALHQPRARRGPGGGDCTIGLGAFFLVQLPIVLIVGRGRRLAVLRPAPVRGHLLARPAGVGLPPRRAPRQLVVRPAAVPALVDRQHRLPPHPPPLEPHPELPPARVPARLSRAAEGAAAHASGRACAARASSCGTRSARKLIGFRELERSDDREVPGRPEPAGLDRAVAAASAAPPRDVLRRAWKPAPVR